MRVVRKLNEWCWWVALVGWSTASGFISFKLIHSAQRMVTEFKSSFEHIDFMVKITKRIDSVRIDRESFFDHFCVARVYQFCTPSGHYVVWYRYLFSRNYWFFVCDLYFACTNIQLISYLNQSDEVCWFQNKLNITNSSICCIQSFFPFILFILLNRVRALAPSKT